MAEHQPKRARQSENVYSPDIQQQDDNNEPPDNATEPKAITNIYYDCLERIFDFLHLEDLLNVAGTCKRLQVAAAAKFGDDFGGKKVFMSIDDEYYDEEIHSGFNEIDVFGLKFCLPFLRSFGAKILHLKVQRIDNIYGGGDHLDEYINQYCADTLVDIEFEHICEHHFSSQNFRKPFKNVEKVVMYGDLDELPQFTEWFPNLHYLEISSSENEVPLSLHFPTRHTLHFPLLEHLKIFGLQSDSVKNVFELLRANRQLKSLELGFYYKLRTSSSSLFDALEENTSITKLTLDAKIIDLNANDLIRFASKHPLLVELKLSEIAAEQAIMFIRHLESLKRFDFVIVGRTQFNRLLEELDPKWQHSAITGFNQYSVTLTC